MAALAARWRPRWDLAVGQLAAWSGTAVRRVGRSLPGTAGPLIVSAGCWMLSPWLGVVVLGAIVWTLDRRV